MARTYDKERVFSESLDSLLAGQELKPEPIVDEDAREALAFAEKMAALRPAPTAAFTSGLKVRLLQKLGEKDAMREARRGWTWSLIRHPAYAVALALLFMAVVFGSLWASGVFNPGVTTPEATVLKVAASTNKINYQPGEAVLIQVSLKNITSETLSFREFPPILSVMQTQDKQPVYTFAAGQATQVLAPDETASFTLVWNQRYSTGNLAPSGRYYIELEDLYYQGNAVKLVPDKPVEFRIV